MGSAADLTVSHRDPDGLRRRLGSWLERRRPGAEVEDLGRPSANGMSSETLLVDASWDGADHRLVVRLAPSDDDVPVFPTYDFAMQFAVMRAVADGSDSPVPDCLWLEEDPDVLGAPFFVMRRVDGRVPPDNLPYTFEGWLVEATDGERTALQDDTVWALAGVHGVDLSTIDPAMVGFDPSGPSALRQHVAGWRRYHEWCSPTPIPLVADAFDWLDDHWPHDDGGRPRLSWGDARIGNVIYDGFRPAALLDWEMAGIAPPGVDLGWMAYIHLFFQDVAEMMELPGLPGFLDLDDLCAAYETRTGVVVGDRDFWLVYAAVRYALVMARIQQRRVVFGEVEPSDDPHAGIMHADWLRTAITRGV